MPARRRIAVLCSTDYNTYPVGGMMSFIKDAAPALTEVFDVDFWGVDAGAGVDSFKSDGRLFPVRFFGSVKTGRKIVPNMLRVIWHLRRNRRALLREGYDALYIHGIPLNAGLPGRVAPKLINHVHGLTNPFLMQGLTSWRARLLAQIYETYRRHIVRLSDLVLLAADHRGIEAFRQANPDGKRIKKIENFCDTELFGAAAATPESAVAVKDTDEAMIVHVGRFAHQKDPLLALRAFKAYLDRDPPGPGTMLAMIGDGPLLSEGKALAERLGIVGRVRFLGHRERPEIAGWLSGADLYLYTSHANGYPISLAEAAQSGLPIVSTAVTGVHDLVRPEENGLLVDSRDPEAFASAIAEALTHRQDWGARSRQLAAQYTPEIILERLCKEINDVL